MAKLKRDERVCPFCAEHIKASAIKCRYCQSDIEPVTEPLPEPGEDAHDDVPVVPEPTETVPDVAPERSVEDGETWWRSNLTLALAALVTVAAVAVGGLWWRAEDASATSAPNGVLVGDDARTEVLVAAADLAQLTLSYDYRTLAENMDAARARMTPEFQKEYESTMAQVRDNTTKNEIVLQAVAVSTAIISATDQDAEVLVFLNQSTTAGKGKKQKQQFNRNSLVVALERDGGDWAISKLTALG